MDDVDSSYLSPEQTQLGSQIETIGHDLHKVIEEKMRSIEINMQMPHQNSKKKVIDMDLIEELKARRGAQRLKGEELEHRREEIIA